MLETRTKTASVSGSDLLFPKGLSDRILETLLSPHAPTWLETIDLLDAIIPHVVRAGYRLCTGIKQRFDEVGLLPAQIVDFSSYEELFPHTTPIEMIEAGENKFEPIVSVNQQLVNSDDYEILAEHIITQKVQRKNRVFKVKIAKADALASALTLAGQFRREGLLSGSRLLVNQRHENDSIETILLNHVIKPALQLAGIHPQRVDAYEGASGDYAQLLLPPDKKQVTTIADISSFDLVVQVGERKAHDNAIYLGDYNSEFGVFPNLGFRMPIPGLVRIIDSYGKIPLEATGEPNLNKRGRLVIDRLFSAYELPTAWTALRDALEQSLSHFILSGGKKVALHSTWQSLMGDEYIFRDQYYLACREASLDPIGDFVYDDILQLQSVVLNHYARTSVRLGVPSSTWLLKVGFPLAGQLTSDGALEATIPLSADTTAPYTVGKELRVKFPADVTPYTSFNQIGLPEGGGYTLPKLVASPVAKRIDNVLKGRNLFGPSEHGYTLTTSIVSPGDFDNMLAAASFYKRVSPVEETTFSDLLGILSRMMRLVEEETMRAVQGEASMVAVFADKTRIPIAEIISMVERAAKDFIANGGRGLKEIAYAAMVDSSADVRNMNEVQLERGLQAIALHKTLTPTFMVTPGNITLYDSIMLMGQILLATLADQSETGFTMYIRPSESDVTFNFLLHHYHEIAAYIDPENRKGLRTLFQKAYWDPRYDQSFLRQAMRKAGAGIYYGTAKTYMEARFMAATDCALDEGFAIDEVENLRAFADRKQIAYHARVLDLAAEEGLDPALIAFVDDFIARHKLYPETLNAIILLPDIAPADLRACVSSIIDQVVSMRGSDCTNANKVWVPRCCYEEFLDLLEEEASGLAYGNVLNPQTRLAQYETDYLKGTASIVASDEETRIITPVEVETGNQPWEPINPRENYTGMIVTELDAHMLLHGDPVDTETYLAHLAKELPLPWLSVVAYDDLDQVLETMERVLAIYSKRSGYPRYLYVAAFGEGSVVPFEEEVRRRGLTDLFKKGEEAFRQFLYYRPHQGSFFINDLLRL